MNISTAAAAAIAKLTAKGFDTMTAVANHQLSFFDDGIVAGSGIWGECFVNEMGHKSSGVINQLVKLGLFDLSTTEDGSWYSLTELGVEVAQRLAAPAEEEEEEEAEVEAEAEAPVAAKPMTRKECVAALKAAGYEGPTSYLMPKLRDLVAQHAA